MTSFIKGPYNGQIREEEHISGCTEGRGVERGREVDVVIKDNMKDPRGLKMSVLLAGGYSNLHV